MIFPQSLRSYVGLAAYIAHGVSASTFESPTYSNNFGTPGVNASYDYVVVGGGIAGLVMACRLSENSSLSVAVVEAGGFYEQEDGNQTIVPGFYGHNLLSPLTSWNFETVAQPQLQNQSVVYPRGKTLGGSSALNGMLYQRGSNGSYQAWADAVGDNSWNFANFLPFFDKSVNFTAPTNGLRDANATVPPPSAIAYNSYGGPLHVSHPNTAAPISSWGQLALRAIGIADVEDFSSGELIGSQYCPLTVRPDDETRSTSESSYLQAAFARNELFPNLAVYIHTLGSKIIFDANKTATGILVKSSGVSYILNATQEVIVSAGAVQSPQLLMVSGIGPKEELAKQNISVIADRPGVGQNMWDHVLFPVTHAVDVETIAVLENPAQADAVTRAYILNKTGILTTNNADYLGWEKVPQSYYANLSAKAKADLATFPSDWPDFEHIVLGLNPTSYLPAGVNYASLSPALITPLSRGNITLSSSSMDDSPLINVGWLTNPTDLETALIGIKRARDFFATSVIQGVLVGEEILPGKNVTTDAQIVEWAKTHVQTVYHASCTCKMGKITDPMAVTDSRARVIGVNNLRVVDASTLPLLIPGHPQSTIYALAEKIAHHILTRT